MCATRSASDERDTHAVTHFPQNFLIPFWFFLCSGETGEFWPESTPDELAETSGDGLASVFPAAWRNGDAFSEFGRVRLSVVRV